MRLFYGWVIVAVGIVLGCVGMGGVMSFGVFLQPPLGGWLFDRFGGYGWLYIASSVIGIAAALIAMTMRLRRSDPLALSGLPNAFRE
jgi:MFS family permease